MTTTAATPSTSHLRDVRPAPWAWWGVGAAAFGLAGNLIASHGVFDNADASTALADASRSSQHLGTLLGMASFVCLMLLAAGWRRWAGPATSLAGQAIASSLTVTATLVLFGAALRGAMAEYLPGGINDDNFTDDGVFVYFMLHDTAPWFAWWGVLLAAGLVAYLSFRSRVVPRWLGVVSVLALVPPLGVMAGSGAVAGAGFVAPIWLAVASITVAVRGLPEAD